MSAIETDSGHVLAVTISNVGTVLEGDHSSGATTLTVDDCADLDDTFGGQLAIDGVTYAYSSVDDEASTIVISPGLTADQDDQTEVSLLDPLTNLIATESIASVTLDGSDPGDVLQVHVRAALIDQLPGGIRGIVGESVSLQKDEHGTWELVDVIGRVSTASVQFLNTDTATATADDTDVTIALTHTPIAGSEHVRQNGVTALATEWSRSGSVLTIPASADIVVRVGDVFDCAYAYNGVASTVLPPDGSYANRLLDLNPLWFALFSEPSGTTVTDLSVGGRNGQYNGPTLGATGLVPNLGSTTAADFDGTNDNVDCQTSGSVTWLDNAGIALLAWVKFDTTGTQQTIIARDDNGAYGVPAFNFYRDTTGKLVMKVWIGTTPHSVTGATTLSTSTLYMVVGRYDGAHLTVRYNAVPDGSAAQAGSIDTNALWGAQVGGHGLGGGATHFLNGTIASPAIFTTLSDADCDALYAAGLAT